MKIADTKIKQGGVIRCCFSGVFDSVDADTPTHVGHELTCIHCQRVFRLTKELVWRPVDFLDKEADDA